MANKLLIIIVFLVFSVVSAQELPETPSVSPARAALNSARDLVVAGKPDEAVAVLQQLADSGFTAVNAITGDAALSALAGRPDFDALVDEMSALAYPCEHDPRFSEFDFWVGTWDVHVADGTLAGSNRIVREERGCLLSEYWTSARGGTGRSINYHDDARDEWVQIWNDASGSQINIRGGLTDDGMLLVGTIHYVASDTTFPFRGLWTPLEDGRVRQFFEQSNDNGVTWTPWFEGFYTRQSTDGKEQLIH